MYTSEHRTALLEWVKSYSARWLELMQKHKGWTISLIWHIEAAAKHVAYIDHKAFLYADRSDLGQVIWDIAQPFFFFCLVVICNIAGKISSASQKAFLSSDRQSNRGILRGRLILQTVNRH